MSHLPRRDDKGFRLSPERRRHGDSTSYRNHPASGEGCPACEAKNLRRRRNSSAALKRDYSQVVRRGFQFAFLLMNVFLGGVFYFWVRQFGAGRACQHSVASRWRRGLAADRGDDEPEVFHPDASGARASSGAAMFLLVTFASIAFLVSQGILQLAPVRWARYSGIPVASRARRFFAATFALRAGSTFRCGIEISVARIFVWAVSTMGPQGIVFIHAQSVRDHRRREDAQLLPHTGNGGRDRDWRAGRCVSSWCRTSGAATCVRYGALLGLTSLFSPDAHPLAMKTLASIARRCAKACPSSPAGGQADHHQICRVHGMSRMRSRLPGTRRACKCLCQF